jgi:hypothetical protein
MHQTIAGREQSCTPTERRSIRRYQVELFGSALAYVVLLLLSVHYVDTIASKPLKGAVALLPMAGIAGMAVAMVRLAMRMDELQRQTLLVSAAIGGLTTAVATMALGFLESAGIFRSSMTFVWPIFIAASGICLPVVRRHYR